MQNYRFTPAQQQQALRWLVFFHILVIAASNSLVQFPFSVTLPNGFEVHSTWGALSFPFIFLATDLTVRIFGQSLARRIIFFVMFPALLVSYAFSVLFQEGAWTGWSALAVFVMPVFRIALASFAAYVVGQILDIVVFNRLRQLKSWWIAPAASTFAGSSDAFMAANWPHIAFVDYLFKLVIGTLFFLPAYGLILNILTRKLTTLHQAVTAEAVSAQPEAAGQSN